MIKNEFDQNIELKLINLQGQQLWSKAIPSGSPITIDLQELTNGIYFLKGIGNHQIYLEKLVIEKKYRN